MSWSIWAMRRFKQYVGSVSHELSNQADQLRLPVNSGLGKDRFELIAGRLPGNAQLHSCGFDRKTARKECGEPRLRRRQVKRLRKNVLIRLDPRQQIVQNEKRAGSEENIARCARHGQHTQNN